MSVAQMINLTVELFLESYDYKLLLIELNYYNDCITLLLYYIILCLIHWFVVYYYNK